jgi:hypothetical protein
MTDEIINSIVTCKPMAVEQFLLLLRNRLKNYHSMRRTDVRRDSGVLSHSANASRGDSCTVACDQPSATLERGGF